MTSSAERASPFSTPSAGRRILHKFASPFGQKTRSISEFTVKAHDPHKQYSPGEKVKGAVIVKVVKPIRLTHISVCLHGFVQVHKTPGLPTESNRGYSSRIGRTQGKKSGEYFGNGFASLFEDESVLCGEGRLAEGSYRFDFEVTFPKDIDLPSSIEFERGTISYMITATLTRPTTMNPTLSHDQRLFLCERIDIASLLPPKPRTITLEPVPRRSRPKGPSKRLTADGQGRAGTSSVSGRTQESARSSPLAPTNVVSNAEVAPRTPSLSEASVDSRVSSSVGRISASGSGHLSQRTSDSLNRFSNGTSASEKTITATVESLKGGCLRGDSIPIRVMVSHTKHIKSMNGVIITLYRLARVDLHPALPLGPMTDGQKRKYEDYYPKSLTGLGGLSLSGTGTSHTFRKDLAQTLVPMIVDPQTLRSEINARVRVPDDAFPTINTVPGAMISFRYYIEVVLDIQGKLAGSDKFFSQRGTSNTYGGNLGSPVDMNTPARDGSTSLFQFQGPGVLDTAPIRRDKSVVTSVFEVVVGTMDSDRKKGKARAQTPPEDENVIDTSHLAQPTASDHENVQANLTPQPPDQNHHPNWYEWGPHTETSYNDDPGWYHNNGYEGYFPYENGVYESYDEYSAMPHYVPPPPLENEADLPEKERLRRAEARLMPSQPPETSPAAFQDSLVPSAPILPESQAEPGCDIAAAGPSRAPTSHLYGRSGPDVWSVPDELASTTQTEAVAVPADGAIRPEPTHQAHSQNDDKQELQRRELELSASAPPNMAAPVVVDNVGPSAPALQEDMDVPLQDYDYDHRKNAGEHLPQYYR